MKKVSLWDRFLLLFKKAHYSWDTETKHLGSLSFIYGMKYKILNNKFYILEEFVVKSGE